MKIAMYDLEGHLLEVFEVETYRDLELSLRIPQGSLNACISGKQLSTIKRQFREYKDNCRTINRIGDISMIGNSSNKPIHKYYNGNYICSYDSAKKASDVNDIDMATINRCLNDKANTAGGFEWKYAN